MMSSFVTCSSITLFMHHSVDFNNAPTTSGPIEILRLGLLKKPEMRDQTDSVAKTVHAYSEAEFNNETLKDSLTNLANLFIQIGTYRDEEAHLIESTVVKVLTSYDESLRPVREELKQLISLRDKQQMRRKHLDRVKEKGYRNRQEISAAEVELVKVTGQVQRCAASAEDMVDSFERQKVRDLRSLFQSFLKIQLRYHSKALELLTRGYQVVSTIDEDLDFQEFSSVLRADPNLSARHSTVKRFPIPKTISLTNSIDSLLNGNAIEAERSSFRIPEFGMETAAAELVENATSRTTQTTESCCEDKTKNKGTGDDDSILQKKEKEEEDEEDEEEEENEEARGDVTEEEVEVTPIAAPRISLGQSASSSPFSSPISSPIKTNNTPKS